MPKLVADARRRIASRSAKLRFQTLGALASMCVVCVLVIAQPAHSLFKDDFLVSGDAQAEFDQWPRIIFDSAGNFVIVWLDIVPPDSIYVGTNCGIDYARSYWKNGNARTTAFPVMPDTMRARQAPCVASLRDGRFWVVFNHVDRPGESSDAFVSQFDANGNELRGTIPITSEMPQSRFQAWPRDIDIAMDESRIAIVLEDMFAAQLFVLQTDSQGNNIGLITRVDSGSSFTELVELKYPGVSYGVEHSFVVAFQALIHNNPDYSWDHALRRYYDSLTRPLGDLAVMFCGDSINMDCSFYTQCPVSGYPQLASADVGSIVASVSATFTCNRYPWAYFQSFHFQGDSLSSPVPLNDANSVSLNNWLIPRIAGNGHGLYVVAWMDGRYYGIYDSKADLVAQLVDSAGTKYGKNVVINSIPQSPGAILNEFDVAIHDSQVVIAWSDYRNGPQYSFDIYCQMMELRDFVWFMPGDCDGSRDIAAADIIWLVNYVFKGGVWPQPRVESGDVNADCSITAADIIVTVNYVFKSGLALAEGCAEY